MIQPLNWQVHLLGSIPRVPFHDPRRDGLDGRGGAGLRCRLMGFTIHPVKPIRDSFGRPDTLLVWRTLLYGRGSR